MSVLQHYYTSFVHPQTNRAGFQVKARSEGISPETEMLIARLIAYQFPPSMDESDIQSHPVALRYYYQNPRECIFLCSQSNGEDENGRPGNFFAHTLVMEPEEFTTIPPIFYWKSSFWHKNDMYEERPQLDMLPTLAAFEEAPSLDVEQIWNFLAAPGRNEHLHKLMSALVHCHKTLRRIVIVDTANQVALWIAAMSGLLPPAYRPLLSFATYHHDPRQGQFMITGTTRDSYFRNTEVDYFTYFVFDAETERISEGESSPYADLVASAVSADQYETQTLPFFAFTMRRFSHLIKDVAREELADYFEQLDAFALYYALVEQPAVHLLSEAELRAVDLALTGFEQLRNFDEDDIIDLTALSHTLELSRELETGNKQFYQLQKRLESLLKASKHFSG
jgi:GTPase-associated protein 1, N-terminal domain type 2/GTPase-associated protein 1, middle domain